MAIASLAKPDPKIKGLESLCILSVAPECEWHQSNCGDYLTLP